MERTFHWNKTPFHTGGMLMENLGIGLIGSGYMGKCHALAWGAVRPVFGEGPTPRLVALAEATEDLATRRANELGFERGVGDWRSLLGDPAIDVISVTSPNQFHAEMAVAALGAGKHVWCEKPMATTFADAKRMRDAARAAGRVAVVGYNYIQNPIIRHAAKLIAEGAIGTVNHVRLEMDEDFMADGETPFSWKSEAASGYGALDDFGGHPLSLIASLLGPLARVFTHQARPYRDRPLGGGGRRAVETFDIASTLFELASGASGVMALNRSAWGRKGRIGIQIFGTGGAILYDQERMNELQLYSTGDRRTEQGFRTILTAPHHPPYDRFIPAPGHSLGFNELKVIECRQLINLIEGRPAVAVTFDDGLEIERTVHAMARSHQERRWVEVASVD